MLLKERLMGKRLILGSGSPRRREILEGAGLEFEVENIGDCEEHFESTTPIGEIPQRVARSKAKSYPHVITKDDILITADTMVISGDQALGKPTDREVALEMLHKLSGNKHSVITGVVIRNNEWLDQFSVRTDVWFRELRLEEIEYYVDRYEPYDKAGAYGIQEWIGYVGISRIEGSFYNVMGLPMQSLYVNLERFLKEIER